MTSAAATLDIRPARALTGSLRVPGDKSISHRYVILGAIAAGRTRLTNLAPGADVTSTADIFRALHVSITSQTPGTVQIDGRGWAGLRAPGHVLDAGNSGTTLRLLTGLLAAGAFRAEMTGDASLRRRPMRRVIDPLTAMGARIESEDGHAPLRIHGRPLTGVEYTLPVASAQVKSALMLAGLRASGTTRVTEPQATRDHSERAFSLFGLSAEMTGACISVRGGQEATAPAAAELAVPGDPSTAAIWASAAAALPGSSVTLTDVCLNRRRTGFVRALERMGARVEVELERGGFDTGAAEPAGTLRISHGGDADVVIAPGDVPDLIDELPVLAARAALGGSLEVSGASELRVKESDRISALVQGFRALGVDAEEWPDGFRVTSARRPTGGIVDAALDHRLVMAFTIVGLGATGPTMITGADAVAISYPGFARDLAALAR
jgi:3-phosphoshikimate 1-carboxyvinyltransferase